MLQFFFFFSDQVSLTEHTFFIAVNEQKQNKI